jgi:hypothetical protein
MLVSKYLACEGMDIAGQFQPWKLANVMDNLDGCSHVFESDSDTAQNILIASVLQIREAFPEF